MFAKGSSDQSPTLPCELNPADPSIGGLFFAHDESLSNQAIDGNTDGPRSKPDFLPHRVYWQGAPVPPCLHDAAIREPPPGLCDAFLGVRHKRLERLHQNQPDVNAGMMLLRSDFSAEHFGLT